MRILLLGAGAEPFLKRGDPPRVDTGAARPPEGHGFVGNHLPGYSFPSAWAHPLACDMGA